jgi:predicted neutral ceramidase superfamily lipid hydrolase
MLQRIQTIYLLIIAILSGITLFFPVADLINTKDNLIYLVDIKGVTLIQQTGNVLVSTTWLLSAFAAVFGIIALITLFSYKNRVKQIRLSVINMLFMLGYYVLLVINIWSASKQLNAEWHLHFATVLPLISLILNYLAIGAIGKDEKLVKSLDRLR